MSKRVIAINRMLGSNGRIISVRLLQRNWDFLFMIRN